MITNQKPQIFEKNEKLLFIFVKEKQVAGYSHSNFIILMLLCISFYYLQFNGIRYTSLDITCKCMHANAHLSSVEEPINITHIICHAKYRFGNRTNRHSSGFLNRIMVENRGSTVLVMLQLRPFVVKAILLS